MCTHVHTQHAPYCAHAHALYGIQQPQAPLSGPPKTACRWAPRTRSDEGFDSGAGCDLHVLRVQPPEETNSQTVRALTGHSPFRAWAGHPCASTAHPVSPHPCPDRRPSVSPAQYLPYRASDEVLVCNLFVPCGATVVYRVVRTTCSLSNVRTMYPNQTRCCLYVLVPVPVPVLCALGSVCPFLPVFVSSHVI